MADEADRGNDTAELLLQVALRNTQRAGTPTAGLGFCLNCQCEVEGDARWCGVECRDDYLRYGTR